MTQPLTIISSMATRRSLAEIAKSFAALTGGDVEVTSIGGVEAAKRIRAGEPFDVAVLAKDALLKLIGEGFVVDESVAVFAHSPTALAVRTGAPLPATCDVSSISQLLGAARTVGVSSGPSGTLIRNFLTSDASYVGVRILEAPPGIPVARLISSGEADVGFQQLSELLGEPGIDVVGCLPSSLVPLTEFAAGQIASSERASSAHAFIRSLYSENSRASLERYGLIRIP
jgi:molybdate transport system substrate-binding protein